jgi:hypothetical protein
MELACSWIGPLSPGDSRCSLRRSVLPPYDRLWSDFGSLRGNRVCSGSGRLTIRQFRYTLTSETEGTQKKVTKAIEITQTGGPEVMALVLLRLYDTEASTSGRNTLKRCKTFLAHCCILTTSGHLIHF